MRVQNPTVVLLVVVPVLLASAACTSTSETAVPAVTELTTTSTVSATSTVTVEISGPTITLPGTTALATTTIATTHTATRTVTAAVTRTVPARSVPTSTPTRAAPATSTPGGGSNPWSSDSEQVAGAPAPQFPASLPQWQLVTSWDTTTRAFSGQWSPVSGADSDQFPSTMNGCDDHRFLVRWNATGSGAQIDAGLADAADSPEDVTTDTAGWMAFDGCQHPIVRFHGDTDELTDVAVSVQEYEPGG